MQGDNCSATPSHATTLFRQRSAAQLLLVCLLMIMRIECCPTLLDSFFLLHPPHRQSLQELPCASGGAARAARQVLEQPQEAGVGDVVIAQLALTRNSYQHIAQLHRLHTKIALVVMKQRLCTFC